MKLTQIKSVYYGISWGILQNSTDTSSTVELRYLLGLPIWPLRHTDKIDQYRQLIYERINKNRNNKHISDIFYGTHSN